MRSDTLMEMRRVAVALALLTSVAAGCSVQRSGLARGGQRMDGGGGQDARAAAGDGGVRDAGVAMDGGGARDARVAMDGGAGDAGLPVDAGPPDPCASASAECMAGATDSESQACGDCMMGTQSHTRTCNPSCTWGDYGDWSPCTGDAVCTTAIGRKVCPGGIGTTGDDCTGLKVRACTCGSSGSWVACGPCI